MSLAQTIIILKGHPCFLARKSDIFYHQFQYYNPRQIFIVEDSLVNETIQARLGGSILLPLNIYIPPKSLGTYALEVETSKGIRIQSMFVLSAGELISPGCFNRSQTTLQTEDALVLNKRNSKNNVLVR